MLGKTRILFAAAVAGLATSALAAGPVAPGDVVINDDFAIEASLTGGAGDPAEGRKVFADRSLGNCLACHAVDDQSEQLFHGEVGPELNGVADRWTEGQLRAIITNSKEIFPGTIMPGFYTLGVGENVREDLVGQTILTAGQVEDVVAYLMTLKE